MPPRSKYSSRRCECCGDARLPQGGTLLGLLDLPSGLPVQLLWDPDTTRNERPLLDQIIAQILLVPPGNGTASAGRDRRRQLRAFAQDRACVRW
jgi:hypothetical protein